MVQDRGPATEAVTIVFIVLATIFVAARFFTRAYIVRSIKQDDWWILAAWAVAVAFSATICAGVGFGLGKHRSDIPEHLIPSLRKSEYAFSVLYNPGLMLTKTSIIVFYLSVMSHDVDPVFKWLNWITLGVVNIAGIALTFLNIFQCRPVRLGYTYPTPPHSHCTDIVTLYQSSAPVNIITDIAILLLPMPILTGMRLPKKQKIILLVTFGFGIFVAVVDVIRIAFLQDAALDRLSLESSSSGQRIVESDDFPWYASLSFMWSAVEVSIGIICACVPSLKPLFARFMPSFIKDAGDVSPMGSFDADTKSNPFVSSGPDSNELNNPAAFRAPSCADYLGEDDGDEMGFLNMLAGPPLGDGGSLEKRPTRVASMISRVSTNRSTASDFDFVKMGNSKNMLKLNNRQSLWPIAVVTIIFFLWGFAYGLLDTLNGQFQAVAGLSAGQTHGLHSAYFGGYLIGPLTLGHFVLARYGFKATMMAGLCVYGCGTLVFWPSAVLTSYPAFVVSNLIVGFGLSCLEVAANPYIALCGPLEYAEVRLNMSQAFQAVGTVVSPLLARKVLFKNVLHAPSLVDVQWAYLGIALFVFALAVIFYYIPLPEATDDQLEEQAERRSAVYGARVGRFPVIWVTLAFGVFAQWCYVGAQEGVGNSAQTMFALFKPNSKLTPFDYITVAHTVFAAGRFLSAFMNYMMTPRWILMVLFMGTTVFSGLQMVVGGDTGVAMLMLVYLFEAGIFSIIYAICMRGMGVHTKWASAFMTAAISGGGVIPVISWAISNSSGSWPYSFSVVTAIFAVGAIFPIYLNFVPAARKQVDPIHERDRYLRRRAMRRQSQMSDPGSDARQFGLAGILARRKKQKKISSDMPTTQHVENSGQEHGVISLTHAFRRKAHDMIEVPSPVHSSNRLKSHDSSLANWPGIDSMSSSASSSAASPTKPEKGGPEEPPPQQPRREWTEKDDVIDDYHNALKSI